MKPVYTNKTLVTSREKEAKGFKKPKDRVTLMTCANATGSIKLPLVFIHKPSNLRCFKREVFQWITMPKKTLGWTLLFLRSGSMKNLFQDSRKHWQKKKFAKKALLLLDNAPSHLDIECLESNDGEITCLYLPPNTTSIIQPRDQGVLETVKRHYMTYCYVC